MRSIDTKYVMRPDGSVEAMSTDEWIRRLHTPEDWEAAHRIGRTEVGRYDVSTVFLSHDHRFHGDGPPILFETMVFDHGGDESNWSGWADLYCERYCTRVEAEAGHARVVAALEAGTAPEDLDEGAE
jgi:hypothetical protein